MQQLDASTCCLHKKFFQPERLLTYILHLYYVQPKGYILIWCDDDQEQGPLHVSNKLSKGGESIVLISQDNQTIIDSLSYTEQTTDVSMGRDPNNVNEFIFFENPTPGLPNN